MEKTTKYQECLFRIGEICLSLFAIFLPWHGTITVFLPEGFRFWKEAVVCAFFLVVFLLELRFWWKHTWPQNYLSSLWAFLFLVWLLILVVLDSDKNIAFISARYLGLFFFVFLLASRFFQQMGERKYIFEKISRFFVFSVFLSLLFGLWAKFFGGFAILSGIYSPTISSWVPGQKIPLFHEADGIARLQGASSGPVEFAALLFLASFFVYLSKLPFSFKTFFLLFFLFGIALSASRATLFIFFLALFYYFFAWYSSLHPQSKGRRNRQILGIGLFLSISLLGAFFLLTTSFGNDLLSRAGTSDHFSRPIEALIKGLDSPILGHLGESGPGARIHNLQKFGTDRAFIAENVFADYFFQLGVLGLFFAFTFFVSLFREVQPIAKFFVIAIFLFLQSATLFDMTPVAISFAIAFAFFLKKRTSLEKKKSLLSFLFFRK